MSLAKYGFQTGVQYSKVGLTNVLYNIRKDDLDKNLNDLLNCPSICVALAAIIKQCKPGFKLEVIPASCKVIASGRQQ